MRLILWTNNITLQITCVLSENCFQRVHVIQVVMKLESQVKLKEWNQENVLFQTLANLD